MTNTDTTSLPAPSIACLKEYDALSQDALFANLDYINRDEESQDNGAGVLNDSGQISKSSPFTNLSQVLLCHGLSPIEDSILLLADIGRASRVSFALAKPMKVMLADISWMSFNRSIRQFQSLTPRDVDTGLRVCLDKRQRLYRNAGLEYQVHEIAPHRRANGARDVNRDKLTQISSRYLDLARNLWGEDSVGRLDPQKVKDICRQLEHKQEKEIPEQIRAISKFPGVMAQLETALKPHLEILRAVARQFNSFDEEIFTYFFAQYYAQDEYRGTAIKVAPYTERNFDDHFDKLDIHFRAWGEENQGIEGSESSSVANAVSKKKSNKTLSACYLPQYNIGEMKILPYTPLSLDALQDKSKNHLRVKDRLILLGNLTDSEDVWDAEREKVGLLLRKTSLAQRNRLLADVASFIALCNNCGWDGDITVFCASQKHPTFYDLLREFSGQLADIFSKEESALKEQTSGTYDNLKELWNTWLSNADQDFDYVPFHLYLYCLEEPDWVDAVFNAASALLVVAQRLYDAMTG